MAERIFTVYDRAATAHGGPLRDDPLASGWRRVRDPAAARFVVENIDLFTLDPRDPAAVIAASSRYPGDRDYFTQLNPRAPRSSWPSLFVPLRVLADAFPSLQSDNGVRTLLMRSEVGFTDTQLAGERAQAESQAAQTAKDDARARAQAKKIGEFQWSDLAAGWRQLPSEGKLVALALAVLAVVVIARRV